MISNNEARLFFTASKSPGYSYIATILMTLFTFITVLILSNILTGIVVNNYDEAIKAGDRGFWVNRLHVVTLLPKSNSFIILSGERKKRGPKIVTHSIVQPKILTHSIVQL